jgi:hypothetical protein
VLPVPTVPAVPATAIPEPPEPEAPFTPVVEALVEPDVPAYLKLAPPTPTVTVPVLDALEQ